MIVLRFTLASVTTDVLAFLAPAVVGFLAHGVAGRTEQAVEADRMRAALLAAVSDRGGRIELRVIDCGPGVPEADREWMFVPFQRLGDTSRATGVGLGLAVSRGLTEAMRGTLQPAQTPGGGLTMTMSLPAAPKWRG